MKIGSVKAMSTFLIAVNEILHLHVHRETTWYLDSKKKRWQHPNDRVNAYC